MTISRVNAIDKRDARQNSLLCRIANGLVHQVQKMIFEARWQHRDVGRCDAGQFTGERQGGRQSRLWAGIDCAGKISMLS